MSKKKHIVTLTILIILLLITGTYSVYHYNYEYEATEWFRESVGDGDYVIVGEEVGNAVFGGDTEIFIAIFDYVNSYPNEHDVWFYTKLDNDGKKLTESNYSIEYTEEYIRITLKDSNNKVSEAYRFYFEDFEQ